MTPADAKMIAASLDWIGYSIWFLAIVIGVKTFAK